MPVSATSIRWIIKHLLLGNSAIQAAHCRRNKRSIHLDESFKTQGSATSDLQFALCFAHPRSGLSLATYRAYNSTLARWINRDPIGIEGGINLYAYVGNSPTGDVDPGGLAGLDRLERQMLAICACTDCVPASSRAECEADARKIAKSIIHEVWYRYAVKGNATGVHGTAQVAGYRCWDWAAFFAAQSANSNIWKTSYRPFIGDRVNQSLDPKKPSYVELSHWAIRLGTSNRSWKCSLSIDDGGLVAREKWVHSGRWFPKTPWTRVERTPVDPNIFYGNIRWTWGPSG